MPRIAPNIGLRPIIAVLLMLGLLLVPELALAFSGVDSATGCPDLVSTPERFFRHRDADITYMLTPGFEARYPDTFSQYLVEDVAWWWSQMISGYSWSTDVHDRFSYFRRDDNRPVYELKSILMHEFGHAMGMQHSDACYYNTNSNTGMAWESNHRSAGGGNLAVQPTIGPELLNESWEYSSPGMKAPIDIDGYNRSVGLDGFEFLSHAYPFLSTEWVEIESGSPLLTVDSTNGGGSGGQTTFMDETEIVAGDTDQGWFMDRLNIWIGNSIDIESRFEYWNVQNNTGVDIRQITVRTEGSSTRRAIFEAAPPAFTLYGVNTTSSPEQMIHGWSTDFASPWSPGGGTNSLSLALDVHDWTPLEALMWQHPGNAFPIALPSVLPVRPWGYATPNTPPPGGRPSYAVVETLTGGPVMEPDDPCMVAPDGPPVGGHLRGFRVALPDVPDTAIEEIAYLPIEWAEAELLRRQPHALRNASLERRFDERQSQVKKLVSDNIPGTSTYRTPERLGFASDRSLMRSPANASYVPGQSGGQTGGQDGDSGVPLDPPITWYTDVDLDDSRTYLVRTVVSTPAARVTGFAMPELDKYQGTRMARCSRAADPVSCCPYEMGEPVLLDSASWRASSVSEPTCVVGRDLAETIRLDTADAHLVATGKGDDRVTATSADSIVFLGPGNDTFEAESQAASQVDGGTGADQIVGSDQADALTGGADDDVIKAAAGADLVEGGTGNDQIFGGPGNDEIHPGAGFDTVDAGEGDDRVIFSGACELLEGADLDGGPGHDVLVLPGTQSEAMQYGLVHVGFEEVIENASRDSRFPACD